MKLIEKLKNAGYDAIAVAGPTASGKTALAIELCRILGAEIISCDSMQIYQKMNIGTAKASEEERAMAPHHLIDILPLSQSYSAADYVKDAERVAEDIAARGSFPIFCGGTGMYLESVMRGEYPDDSVCNFALREELTRYAQENGNAALHARLRAIDPDAADAIHENNVKRVVRALEIAESTGSTKTENDRRNKEFRGKRIFVVCLCYHDRELLYRRIEKRVDIMIEQGLCRELETLMADPDFMNNATARAAIGYKELFPYAAGEAELEECVSALKTASRRYAKRQLTWFLNRDYVKPLYCDDENGQKSTEELAREYVRMIELL